MPPPCQSLSGTDGSLSPGPAATAARRGAAAAAVTVTARQWRPGRGHRDRASVTVTVTRPLPGCQAGLADPARPRWARASLSKCHGVTVTAASPGPEGVRVTPGSPRRRGAGRVSVTVSPAGPGLAT